MDAPYKKLKLSYEDIERQTVEENKITTQIIDSVTQEHIIKQVNEEYDLAYSHTESKRKIMLARLKLYNNQRRKDESVGDPLLFTVFNTIHAALYDDRLMVQWEGRDTGDDEVEENLNALSEYDYDVMQKNESDYFWNWDAEFFGRGLLLMMDFDRSERIMAPVPEVIDASTWLRDPRATSVNGNIRGTGAMRFGGREVGATYYELKALPGYFNISSLKKDKDIKSLIAETRTAHRDAQGLEDDQDKTESLGKYNNYEFNLLDWFTTIKGEKYLVTLGNLRSQLVRLIPLKKYNGLWPIIDRPFYPMSQDWDGVSIPDLTEDKQRARAVLLNLGLISAKSEAMPSYLVDRTRIKNKNYYNFRTNKFIEVDGRVDNAMIPLQKSTIHQYVNVIMEILDTASQRATATPEIQQGVQSQDRRTATELNLVSSKVDTRYSMNAKVYGWSEKKFWLAWYVQYKLFFKEKIDEKIIRIAGSLAPKWRPLTRENIISAIDPDVKIESKTISEAKRLRSLQSFGNFAGLVIQDPDIDRRFLEKEFAKLNGLHKETIDMIFPPTMEELHAEDENDLLNLEKMPQISLQDDHLVHLRIHTKAEQSVYTMAHIRSHKKAMILKRNRLDLFPQTNLLPFTQTSQRIQENTNAGGAPAPVPAPNNMVTTTTQ